MHKDSRGIFQVKSTGAGKFPAARRGSALAIALMYISVFVILGGAIYKLMRSEMISSVNQSKKTAALYIAEAGMEDALQVLIDTPSWRTGFANKPFEKGFYTVIIDSSSIPAKVTSKGWVSGGFPLGITVKAAITQNVTLSAPVPEMFSYAIGSAVGGITLENNAAIIGNVFSTGTISMAPGSSITGSSRSIVYPDLNLNIPKPAPLCNYTSTMTTLGSCSVNGDLNIADKMSVTLTGTLYITGILTVDNGAALKGAAIVYVGGNLYVNNNGALGDASAANSPFIYAPGPGIVELSNNSVTLKAVIYAPYRSVDLFNNSAFSGSLIGHSVTLHNNAEVTAATVSFPGELGWGGVFSVVRGAWNQIY